MPSAYSSDEFEEQYTYDGNDLGATWTSEKTTFKVWAPTADHVQLKLYESGTQGTDDCIETLDMTKGKNGVWWVEKEGDQNGVYYTYNVTVEAKIRERHVTLMQSPQVSMATAQWSSIWTDRPRGLGTGSRCQCEKIIQTL